VTAQTFAIDYDGTYAAAPALWGQFIAAARLAGHRVLICTGRAFAPVTLPDDLEVHCTAGQAKADYLASLGINVDVWIDDDPSSVITDGI
jgi:hypothetical protein